MIDLGLTKLAIIGVVALVVIGPEKLPKVARTLGSLYGRAQRYIHDVKAEVSREIELEELRNIQKEVQEAAKDVKADVEEAMTETELEIRAAFNSAPTSTILSNQFMTTPSPDKLAKKARDFRRKKLARTAAVPIWYKQRNTGKTHVTSASARVAKHRPASKFYSFY